MEDGFKKLEFDFEQLLDESLKNQRDILDEQLRIFDELNATMENFNGLSINKGQLEEQNQPRIASPEGLRLERAQWVYSQSVHGTNGSVSQMHQHPFLQQPPFQANPDIQIHESPPCNSQNTTRLFAARIYYMAKDQHGCRYLESVLKEGTDEEFGIIFSEVMKHILELMMDPVANSLVSKLIGTCDENQRSLMLRLITLGDSDFVNLSRNNHGSQVLQKLIRTLKTPEQFSMVVSSFKPWAVSLMKNINGYHLVQCCLEYLPPESNQFLFEAATTKLIDLATDRHGCRVLQKCIAHSNGEIRNHLISKITSNALMLSQDRFGNYIVQLVFDLRVPWATEDMFARLQGNYVGLSLQKYSSNVVEKCIKEAGEERRSLIIIEMINNPGGLGQVMLNQYGNYVFQAALKVSKGYLQSILLKEINRYASALQFSPHGKKILNLYHNVIKKEVK